MTARSQPPEHLRPTEPPATERQLDYIANLLKGKIIPANDEASGEEREAKAARMVVDGSFTKANASKTIEWLLSLPNKTGPREGDPKPWDTNVESGYYAVEHDGVMKFYKLDRPKEGRWEGYTFLKVQASDEFHRIRGVMAREVLALIEEDPVAAMRRYGQLIGKCGVCGRTLTDEVSRQYGIGPVCRENGGF